MSLEIQQREKEGVVILDMKGRLTVGPETTSFRDRIDQLVSNSQGYVILNMGGIDYVDSTGLGAMVICSTSLRKRGGAVKLLNLNKRNLELLVVTKLATVFDLFADEQDAVNSFFPDRKLNTFDILTFVRELKEE